VCVHRHHPGPSHLRSADHTGIGVSFPEWDVDDAEVDQQLEAMRERFAEVDEVERPAAVGDLVTLDLEVEVDGVKLEDATVEDALYEVGSEGVTPKLDEEVVGKAAGDTFTYEDELPEEYPDHGGEAATFHVTVKDVREKTLPALDDDFATSASEFDTIAELRADLERSLTRRKVEQAQHELRGRILEAYLARVDVPLPPAMVEAETANRLHEVEHQAERFGMSVEQLLEAQGLSPRSTRSRPRTRPRDPSRRSWCSMPWRPRSSRISRPLTSTGRSCATPRPTASLRTRSRASSRSRVPCRR
jgi:trigger factor